MTNSYESSKLDYHSLNAMLAIPVDNKINFDADKEAVRRYFLEHVNQNTVFFHSLEEKVDYLVENEYYESETFEAYDWDFVKSLFKKIYAVKFRFRTFMGAYKFYTQYAMKTFDGSRYIERYEDRVVMVALYLAQGDQKTAENIAMAIVKGEYQPATPTFLNAGKKQRGELVSCFLIRIEDNRESISRAWNAALQLSARGGGVAFSMTNLRESGAPIKKIENQASGLIPVMKVMEDIFSYANQLGARDGAGAAYVNMFHPDIMKVLDTKRENADEKIRIKTLSLGLVVPDIAFELAKNNETMHLFSPYDVHRVYGKAMSDISITEHYYEMVANPEIKKYQINPRELFQRIAEIQFESGYPYLVFEDNVNAVNPVEGRISMSNLCSEILQVSTASTYNEDLSYDEIGNDISCNLGSMNIANAVDSDSLKTLVDTAIRALSSVAVQSSLDCVPSIRKANAEGRAIGLGQMNLHGFLGRERIHYGSEEALDFVNIYFMMINYYSLLASNKLAAETGDPFEGFENSTYADGSYFDQYLNTDDLITPKFEKTRQLLAHHSIPTRKDWENLKERIQISGLFNSYRLAVPPTGSISYINDSTASIHPIVMRIENRKEGKTGRVFFPSPGLTNDNTEFFQDAYEIGPEKIIDTYAVASRHTDQGLSLTLFYKSTATTRDLNKAQGYAWKKGIKTMYYIRTRQENIDTDASQDINICTSCSL